MPRSHARRRTAGEASGFCPNGRGVTADLSPSPASREREGPAPAAREGEGWRVFLVPSPASLRSTPSPAVREREIPPPPLPFGSVTGPADAAVRSSPPRLALPAACVERVGVRGCRGCAAVLEDRAATGVAPSATFPAPATASVTRSP